MSLRSSVLLLLRRNNQSFFQQQLSSQWGKRYGAPLYHLGGFPSRLSFSSNTDGTTAADSSSLSQLVYLTVNEESRVATLTLNSPKTFNALTVEMGKQFQTLITTLQAQLCSGEVNANAIVLTGAGHKAFSAGGDLDWLRGLRNNPVHVNADYMISFYKSFLCVRDLPIPVVAAINGPAIGAGACLATACDLRVGSPNSTKIGFTFATLGIHAGMGGSHFLSRAVGQAVANEALLTGKVFTGTEAREVGLLSRLTNSDESDDVKMVATELAEKVARQHPLAVRSMVRSIRLREDVGLETTLQREAMAQAMCYVKGDWGEGIEALVGRRDPVFHDYHDK